MTERDLLEVSYRLIEESDIRQLGSHLGVEHYKVDAILCDEKGNIPLATLVMLKEWRKGQENNVKAYDDLWEALTHPEVDLSHVAHEVLRDPPSGTDNVNLLHVDLTITNL